MIRRFFIGTVLFWLSALHAQQNITFETLSIEQGLSQTVVYSIVQDSRGFLWFGTQDGLNRYDGYNFTVYKNNHLDTASLSDNRILKVFKDRSGLLWIGTADGGLCRFDRDKESFVIYRHDSKNSNSINSNRVNFIAEDTSGNLWLATSGGLDMLDKTTGVFTHQDKSTPIGKALPSRQVNAMLFDTKGRIWIGTNKGLIAHELATEKTVKFEYGIGTGKIIHENILSLCEDHGGMIWIGTAEGLNMYDPATDRFVTFTNNPSDPASLSHNMVWSVFEDHAGVIWVGTQSGLNRYDREEKRFMRFVNDPTDKSSISHSYVNTIFEDNAQRLWFGTYGGGVSRFDPHQQKFSLYVSDAKNKTSLSNNVVWSFYEDVKKQIWVATEYGLNQLDPVKNTFNHYFADASLKNNADNSYNCLLEDSKGNLWVGSYGSGLRRFDRASGRFVASYKHSADPASLIENRIITLLEDRDGHIWVGTMNGLDLFDPQKNGFIHYQNNPDDPASLRNNVAKVLYQDRSGALWVGTQGGLSVRLPGETAFRHYLHDPRNLSTISHNNIRAITEDTSGTLWIGTTGGLNRFDRIQSTFQHYTTKEGLPSDIIYGLLCDAKNRLWISGNKGLTRFIPSDASGSSGVFRVYDVGDGLQSNEFRNGSAYKAQNGEMYFGGIRGFNRFHPDSVSDNPNIPNVVLTQFKIFEKPVALGKDINDLPVVELSYKQNFFSFEFAALNYTSSEKNQYAYRLEGFDNGWVNIGTERKANYTNVDPGTYVFRVKGSNNDLVWNEKGVELKIVIQPPFWQTWWFRIAALALLIFSAVTWYKQRMRRLLHQKQLLEKQVADRTSQLRQKTEQLETTLEDLQKTQSQLVQAEKMSSLGQMVAGIAHEVNTPRATVDHYVFILYRKLQDAVQSQNPDDMRAALENIQEEIVPPIELATERIGEIVEGLLNFARADHKDYRMSDVHKLINSALVIAKNQYKGRIEIIKNYGEIPQIECFPGQLNQVFMNTIVNAVQATPGQGTITITTEMADEKNIRVRIKDTGMGMSEEVKKKIFDPFFTTKPVGQGTGLGLALAYEIMGKHNGKIDVDTSPGKGTEFIFTLPIEQPKKENV